jgi:ribosome-associated protein
VIPIGVAAGLIEIPDEEITFTASRSGGPGGQNVNKVSSRITLEFDVRQTKTLSEDQRRRVLARLATRINKDGVMRVVSQRTRSQDLNRSDALARFIELMEAALRVERARVPTRVPHAVQERRLTLKKKRSETKRLRRAGTENT